MSESKKDDGLLDPYSALPRHERMVTSITLGDADRAFLFSLYPHQSVVQVTMATLLTRFVKAMKEHGVTSYNPEALKFALRDVKITLPNKKEKAKT